MTTNDSTIRRKAVAMLKVGIATPAEVADLAGASRQLVRYWLTAEQIDWRTARRDHLEKAWQKPRRKRAKTRT